MTFEEFISQLIDSYLNEANCGLCNDENILRFYGTLNIEEAIDNNSHRGRFVVNNKEMFDDHYDNFSAEALAESKVILLRLLQSFRECKGQSFMTVYKLVRDSHKGLVAGLADLYYYDTTFRIAASRDIGLLPDDVFLQQGALYGAKLMGLVMDLPEDKPFLPRSFFDRASPAFQRLKPYQIESFLCVKHPELKAFFGALIY